VNLVRPYQRFGFYGCSNLGVFSRTNDCGGSLGDVSLAKLITGVFYIGRDVEYFTSAHNCHCSISSRVSLAKLITGVFYIGRDVEYFTSAHYCHCSISSRNQWLKNMIANHNVFTNYHTN